MHSHAGDLRSEVPGPEGERLAAALLDDWRTAPLPPGDRALCLFAEKLALRPGEMAEEDARALGAAGFDDRAIHDAAQVASYFSYINRVADGLGVDLEPDMPPEPAAEPDPSRSLAESGTMTIIWRCLRCNHHLPAGRPLPEACPSCGAPRTELALVEED
jgi:hypothetical protein